MDGGERIGRKGGRPSRRPLSGRRRERLLLVAALAIMVPLVAASGTSAKVPRSFFGAVPWLEFQGADYQRLAQAKVHNARTPFFWPAIEPSKGDYHWKATDKFVGTLALYHVRVLPFLNGSPSWVTSDPRKPPLKSKRAKRRWKKFVKACVKRYGKHGKFWRKHSEDVPKVPITSWQIWNEPNNYKYFLPKAKPKAYGKLVKLAHRAAKSKDRHAKIILAGMDSDPTGKKSMPSKKFLKKFYKGKGAKRSFNAVAVHPYSPTLRDLKKQMNGLHKVIKRHHDNAKMWITEMGWGSAPPEKRWPLLKGVEGQKKMLKKSFHLLIKHRKRWHLKRVYWFLWRDAAQDAPVNCSFCKSSGLFRSDFKPKPAWDAFLKITHR